MSDPLLGEAGNANPEPAALGGTGGDEFTNLDGTAGSVAKAPRRRRRGSRGGRSRHGAGVLLASSSDDEGPEEETEPPSAAPAAPLLEIDEQPPAVPVAKPKIGDTRPGSPPAPKRRVRKDAGTGPAKVLAKDAGADGLDESDDAGGVGRGGPSAAPPQAPAGCPRAGPGGPVEAERAGGAELAAPAAKARPAPRSRGGAAAVAVAAPDRSPAARRASGDRTSAADKANLERRNRPLGRYLMVVHVGPTATQIAVLEGRTLIEHYVSRPADDATQIDGNIYLGRVQNVLPGMEAAFVDIGTPKNAVLYRGDLHYDDDEVDPPTSDDDGKPTRGRLGGAARDARIEQLLRTGQSIICQVTKNPIGTKGARLTQEVSLPGRFVVLIPDSDTYGISKRLGDDERRRLRKILDDIRPAGHGLIVRTAAEGASADELGRDVGRSDAPVGERPAARQDLAGAATALPGTGPGRARHPGGVQPRLPGRRDRRPAALRPGQGVRHQHHARARRPGRAGRPDRRGRCRCSSGSGCTSRSTRLSTARSGCPRAGRSSSSAPRR